MRFLALDHIEKTRVSEYAGISPAEKANSLDKLQACLIEIARIMQEKQLSVNAVPEIRVETPAPNVTVNVPEQKAPEIKIEAPVSVAPAAVTVVLTPWVILMAGIIPAVATLADIIIRIWFM